MSQKSQNGASKHSHEEILRDEDLPAEKPPEYGENRVVSHRPPWRYREFIDSGEKLQASMTTNAANISQSLSLHSQDAAPVYGARHLLRSSLTKISICVYNASIDKINLFLSFPTKNDFGDPNPLFLVYRMCCNCSLRCECDRSR